MAVSDGSGEVIYRFVYGTYGKLYDIKDGSGTTLGNIAASEGYTYAEMAHALGMEYLYNGQYGVSTDMNGLYYMRARYYDQSIKKFINRDVLSGDIGNSQSLNRFSYVQGNPVSLTDPFGLCPDGNGKIENLVSQMFDSASGIMDGFMGKPSFGWKDVGKAVLGLYWIGGDPVTSIQQLYAYAVAAELDWSAIGHTLLGLAGIVCDAADLINAAWYCYEKNYEMAAVSMLCALPYVGTLVGGSAGLALKVIGKGFTLGFAAESAFESISRAYDAYKDGTLSWWNALDVGINMLGLGLSAREFKGTFGDALAGRTEPGIFKSKGRNKADLGNKLDYQFGKAGGRQHNVDRTNGLKNEMDKLGFDDTLDNRAYFEQYYNNVLNDSSNIVGVTESASYVEQGVTHYYTVTTRESFLMGRYGGAKVTTFWNDNRLLTIIIGSGKETRYNHVIIR